MAKFLVIVLFCAVIVDAAPEYRVTAPSQSTWPKVACSNKHEKERQQYIKNAMCGPPREVFITLKPQGIHEELTPSAVWVKRCKGTCQNGNECHPSKVIRKSIPIRILNVKHPNMQSCSTYEIEEHLECRCCDRRSCEGAQVFSPQEYEVESI